MDKYREQFNDVVNIHKKVLNTISNKRDELFMKNYEELNNSKLEDYNTAISKLFKDDYLQKIILGLQKNNLKSLIGGSMGIYCVLTKFSLKKNKFSPNDIDLYIYDLDQNKLKILDDIIKSIFNDNTIIYTRSPYTVSWYIQLDDRVFILEVNIFKFKLWVVTSTKKLDISL